MWHSKTRIYQQLIENLTRRLRGVDNPRSRTVFAADAIIGYFLEPEYLVKRFFDLKAEDTFFTVLGKSNDEHTEAVNRMCHFADHLFVLCDTDGFDTLLHRIKTRKSRAPFYESKIAYFFRLNGYNIFVRPESGIKGSDFDFRAEKNSEGINVEVTALSNETFTESNIQNVLGQKRNQVPETEPAALYCILPQSWFANVANPVPTIRSIKSITERFFGGSKRFNFISYVWQETVVTDTIISFTDLHVNLPHPNPRHQTSIFPVKLSEPPSFVVPNDNLGEAFPSHFSYLELLSRIPSAS